MTRMCWTRFAKGLRRMALVAALLAVALPLDAAASDSYWNGGKGSSRGWSYSGKGYSGKSYKSSSYRSYRPSKSYSGKRYSGRKSHSYSKPKATTTRSVRTPVTRRTLHARYRSGGGGYSWLNQWNRGSTGNGYTGANTSINTPHRGNWNAKLQAQRRWDEQEYKKMQQADSSNVRCGLSNAPAYCYRLQKPYPQEMYVVRY